MDDYVLPSEPVMDYLTRFSGKKHRDTTPPPTLSSLSATHPPQPSNNS